MQLILYYFVVYFVLILTHFLILYPLRLEAGKEFDTKDNSIKWAIGVGFAGDKPAEDDAHCFVYYLNSVAINQKRLGEDEESDE